MTTVIRRGITVILLVIIIWTDTLNPKQVIVTNEGPPQLTTAIFISDTNVMLHQNTE